MGPTTLRGTGAHQHPTTKPAPRRRALASAARGREPAGGSGSVKAAPALAGALAQQQASSSPGAAAVRPSLTLTPGRTAPRHGGIRAAAVPPTAEADAAAAEEAQSLSAAAAAVATESAAAAAETAAFETEHAAAGADPTAVAAEHAASAAEPAAVDPAPPGFLGFSPELWGKLCLLTVALLWGSYNPLLKVLYAQDGPPGPVAIMLFRGVIQSAVLVAAYTVYRRNGGTSSYDVGGSSYDASRSSSDALEAVDTRQALQQQGDQQQQAGPDSSSKPLIQLPFVVIAAIELGLWLFMATGMQTVGLQLTTATRAGFLIQATALLTPLLASFTGEKPSRNVWLGCLVALAGCLLIAADQSATDADDAAVFSLGGDVAILSSAFFFSLATVRLGTYARRIPSVELAAAKSVVLGCAAVATFGAAAAGLAAAGEPLTDLFPGYTNPLSWAILVWSALGPGAAAAFLHAKGQSVVPPAEAQVIFSTVPLWSLAFAFLLLGGEPMSQYTLVGGAAVVAAGLIASRKPTDPAAESDKAAGKQA